MLAYELPRRHGFDVTLSSTRSRSPRRIGGAASRRGCSASSRRSHAGAGSTRPSCSPSADNVAADAALRVGRRHRGRTSSNGTSTTRAPDAGSPGDRGRRRPPRRVARGSGRLALLGRRDVHARGDARAAARGRDVDAYIVEADGEPVGYLQAWWEEDEPRRGGIDMFLVPRRAAAASAPTRRARSTRVTARVAAGRASPSIRTRGTSPRSAPGAAPASSTSRSAPADDEHPSAWVLMEFQSASGSS